MDRKSCAIFLLITLTVILSAAVVGLAVTLSRKGGVNFNYQYANFTLPCVRSGREYFGQPLGPLSRLAHGVSGYVFIVDEKRLRVLNLTYAGDAPLAFFWIGLKSNASASPDATGFATSDENGSFQRLNRVYRSEDIVLTLKDPVKVTDLRWFSMWCIQFTMNFGSVNFPPMFDVPKVTSLGQFQPLKRVTSVSAQSVTAVNHLTVAIVTFTFQTQVTATDWNFYTGKGENPEIGYLRYQLNSDLQSPLSPGSQYNVTLSFQDSFSVLDADYLAVYSPSTTATALIQLPRSLLVPPAL